MRQRSPTALAIKPSHGYLVAMAAPSNPLDPRARQLLRTLISRYIRDGEPVGMMIAKCTGREGHVDRRYAAIFEEVAIFRGQLL